jgi:Tfp pilus assembly protein PilO
VKLEWRSRQGDDVRALWLLAVLVLCAGSLYIRARYQSAISTAEDRTESLYRQTVADARIVRQSGRLGAIERQALDDLDRVSHDTSISASTANLLGMLHQSARTYDTRVEELQPQSGQTETGALQATPLSIRINGTFRGILGFVEDLSHHATLIRVTDTELALASSAQSNAAQPRLDATIHATLYRLQLSMIKESHSASAR